MERCSDFTELGNRKFFYLFPSQLYICIFIDSLYNIAISYFDFGNDVHTKPDILFTVGIYNLSVISCVP